MREFAPMVYMLASQRNGTLYTGVTSHLPGRVWQHKQGLGSRFTARYGVTKLVWFERHETMEQAITREKRIKTWRRAWKMDLIEQGNPHWLDLFDTLL